MKVALTRWIQWPAKRVSPNSFCGSTGAQGIEDFLYGLSQSEMGRFVKFDFSRKFINFIFWRLCEVSGRNWDHRQRKFVETTILFIEPWSLSWIVGRVRRTFGNKSSCCVCVNSCAYWKEDIWNFNRISNQILEIFTFWKV